MTGDLPSVRIDDADRDRAVDFLRHHCADGRITLDEFSDRVGDVFAAVTATDLERVTGDLPARAPAAPPATVGRGRRAVRWTFSVFGANQQRGRWRIEGETNAISVMGGCVLDLRGAEVVGDEVTITALAIMGGVDIIVPEGIDVVLEGFSLIGGRQSAVKDVPVLPGSPLVRVRAFAIMGGVTVRSRRPPGERPRRQGERGRRRERTDGLERRSGGRDRAAVPEALSMPGSARPRVRRGIDAVAEDVREEWSELRKQVAPEGTVTIFFSDIEAFTTINERLGDNHAQALLREHYRLVREQLLAHRGFEVKVNGDGFMVAFDSAARALRCAIAIQERQRAWNDAHPDDAVRVRIGLHTGEAIRDADDFLGSTVNLASRIATAARGGEILVSSLLRELCASSGEFDFDGGHDVDLKGLSQPHRVYSVRWS